MFEVKVFLSTGLRIYEIILTFEVWDLRRKESKPIDKLGHWSTRLLNFSKFSVKGWFGVRGWGRVF